MSTQNNHKLFSYGTLRYEHVQMRLFGRLLHGVADSLPGYRLSTIQIKDPNAVATSGEATHLIVLPTGNSEDQIPGMVFDITDDELKHADDYEDVDYDRVLVKLVSGASAWVYVGKN